MRKLIWVVCLMSAASAAFAFNGQRVTAGKMTVEIGEILPPTPVGKVLEVTVTLENASAAGVKADVELCGLVDEWRVQGAARKTAEVAAGGSARVTFGIVAGPGIQAALYPVRARVRFAGGAEGGQTLEAVRVFSADPGAAAKSGAQRMEPAVLNAPARGGLLLERQTEYRVGWAYGQGQTQWLPVSWQGQEPVSKANFSRTEMTRGQRRRALGMHPAYGGGQGPVFVEYRLRLPQTTPLALEFGNAIRDSAPREPKSDGVTFRVWADDGSGKKKLYERHTASKVWVDGRADLAAYAGKDVRLTLECHPGPKMDTTCDSAFWGEPTVVAGAAPAGSGTAATDAAAKAALGALAARHDSANAWFFDLGTNHAAALALGANGLADGALAFAAEGRTVVYRGMWIEVLNQRLGAWPSGALITACQADKDPATGQLRIQHKLTLNGKETIVTVRAWSEGDCLRVGVACPERLTMVAPGPATDRALERLYFGHGYAVEHPAQLKLRAGGHALATSHVGFEFEGGAALLVACDNPPDFLEVNPEEKACTLLTHMDSTFAFVPGARGALDCAVRYRPHFEKPAAGGVARKAGRFVFDIWGGKYSEIGDLMARAFAYGATDSMLMIHSWQRWGYDYRLPDIYPPNPGAGTLEELRRVGTICRGRDVPWGLHDNYIDFYPDADGFSYNDIEFSESGQPMKAWLNQGREAQSYTWRPDRFQPWLKRNLELIGKGLAPTASFVDVFASKSSTDFYDRQGNFHSALETRKAWGEAFAAIRNAFEGGPTVSEAGGDHLIGWLDGADCQFLDLTAVPKEFAIMAPCADWERVPWADAVYHTKYILHGAGYSTRYQNVRSRRSHGIESDDYLASEMLTGHALMTDSAAGVRGAVRKYWLAQDFVRSLAADQIAGVDFEPGDMHRVTVRWASGATVRVNRSAADWTVEGRVLPQHGFLARGAWREAAIERLGGTIVERSQGAGGSYVNGRGNDVDAPLPLTPAAGKFADLGGGRFRLGVDWTVSGAVGRDLTVFVHVRKPVVSRLVRNEVASGGRPPVPTSRWQGLVTTGADQVVTIPAEFPAGQYDVLVGLTDPKLRNRGRVSLLGDERDDHRYLIARLVVEKKGNQITALRLEPSTTRPEPYRFNMARQAVDFGELITAGAMRWQATGAGAARELTLTPLPNEPGCEVGVRLDRVGLGALAKVEAVDETGKPRREVPARNDGGVLRFATQAGEFAYRVK